MVNALSGIVLRHTRVDSEHVTGGFRARKNCERVSSICVLKSVILVIKCRQLPKQMTYNCTEDNGQVPQNVMVPSHHDD